VPTETRFYKHREYINEEAFIFWREWKTQGVWYIRIRKQPHWKDQIARSLKTKDKAKALKKAEKMYAELIASSNVLQQHIFLDDDKLFAQRNMALGNLAEDRFKNIMMYQGYEVYTPMEDIWGSDVILIKGDEVLKVQVKSSNIMDGHFQLQNNKGIKYKELCTHMAFIHLQTQKIYLIPCNELRDVSCMKHHLLEKNYAHCEVNCID